MADLIHYHAPHTRSATIRWLFEELDVPHELRVLKLQAGEHKSPEYLRVNPMGKVPAIVHGDQVVTESPAICLYLGDAFPEKGLAPKIGDPKRAAFVRWMFYYGSCVEPALLDKALQRPAGDPRMVGYGSYDAVVDTLSAMMSPGPYILGDTFSVADVLYGSGIAWTMMFKMLPERPEFVAYVARMRERPASQRAHASDQELLAKLAS